MARCRCTWRGCGVGGRARLFKVVQAKKPKLRFPSFMGQLVRSGAAGVWPVKVASCKSRAASYATNTSQQRSPLASQTVKVAASTAAFDAGIGVFATSALLQRGKGAKPTSTVDFGNIQNAKVLYYSGENNNEKTRRPPCCGNPQDKQKILAFCVRLQTSQWCPLAQVISGRERVGLAGGGAEDESAGSESATKQHLVVVSRTSRTRLACS